MDGFVDDLHFIHEFTSVSYYGYVCYDCGYNAGTILSKQGKYTMKELTGPINIFYNINTGKY